MQQQLSLRKEGVGREREREREGEDQRKERRGGGISNKKIGILSRLPLIATSKYKPFHLRM